MIKRYLLHDRLLVRFIALWVLVGVFFLGAWTLSYFFLPEGVLRGRTGAQILAGDDLAGGSVWLEWLRIFAINLGVMVSLMIAPNLLRGENGYPLGYTIVGVIAVIYAITLGTNSFSIPMESRIAPTFAVFGRSGVYEVTAYALATAATTSIAKFRLKGKWPQQTIEKMEAPKDRTIILERTAGVLLAVAILIAACGWEAYRIAVALS